MSTGIIQPEASISMEQTLWRSEEAARTILEQTEMPGLSKSFRAAEVRQLVQHVLQKAGA
jgi:hypothetical protein